MSPEWIGALPLVIVDSSLRVVVVAALVALILLTARVRSHAVRHAAWTSVLCAMLLMPILPRVLPSIEVGVPASTPRLERWTAIGEPEIRPAPSDFVSASDPSRLAPIESVRSPRATPAAAAPATAAIWPLIIAATYGMGLFALLLRLAIGWRATARIARHASRAPVALGKAGERESVVEFLERSAALRPVEREQLLRDATAIHEGRMPRSFQYMMARGG